MIPQQYLLQGLAAIRFIKEWEEDSIKIARRLL